MENDEDYSRNISKSRIAEEKIKEVSQDLEKNLNSDEEQNVQVHIKEISELGLYAMNEYEQDEDKYINRLKNEIENLKDLCEKELINRNVISLRGEKISEEMERDHSIIEGYKEEAVSLEKSLNIEINKNSTVKSSFQDGSLIDKIYSNLEFTDLSTVEKFKKFILEDSEKNNVESVSILKGAVGEYLKRQAAVLYFLHLIKNRYSITVIPQEASENLEHINPSLAKKDIDTDQVRLFETNIRVVYNTESFLINCENEEKRTSYTFKDLKEEACDVFNIRHEFRESYHIVNDKFYVYSNRILAWDVHKQNLESKKSSIEWAHMELMDRMSVFNDRSNIIQIEKPNQSNQVEEQNLNQTKNPLELTSEELFTSEVEDYVRFYRRFEAVKLLFKKDYEKKEITTKYFERIEKLAKERDLAKNALILKTDEDTTDAYLDKKFEEAKKLEEEKKKDELFKYKRKPENPIYLSMKTLFYFKFLKYLYFLISIIFAVSFYLKMNRTGLIDIKETYNMNTLINNNVIFNPIFKHFLRNVKALKKRSFEDLVRTKSDLLIWLNILFNNLVMDSGDIRFPEGVDTFNNFFQRDNTIYEVFNGIKLTFKTSQALSSEANRTFFKLPSNITKDIRYYNEYHIEQEDTSPKFCDKQKYQKLLQFDDKICKQCFSEEYLYYNASESVFISEQGAFGDYEGGNFELNLNYLLVNRDQFDLLFMFIKDMLIDPGCRMFMISMNVVHIYYKSLLRLELIFEFSTIDGIKITSKSGIVDTQDDNKMLTQILEYVFDLNVAVLCLTLFLRLSTMFLVRNKVRTINSLAINLDILLLFLFFYQLILHQQYVSLKKSIIGDLINLTPSDYNSTNVQSNNPFAYTYIDLDPLLNLSNIMDQISGFILLLLILRIIFYLFSSPLLSFFVVLGVRTIKSIFNVFVVLTIFMISFSLILHSTLGSRVANFTELSKTILISLFSLFGALSAKDFGDLSALQFGIIILFLFITKFIFLTFIFAIIKETFEDIRKAYLTFTTREHFKISGESVITFIKYSMFPLNFYFLIDEYLTNRRIYRDVDLENFVKEQELRPGLTYHKLVIEKRTVYLVHEFNANKN